MNIYVGNLSPETTEEDLRQTFEAFGQVISVKVLRDRVTGESNGFGFVGMSVSDEGQTAISELNGKDLKGHTIKVEEGRMKTGYRSDRDRQDGFDRGGRGDRDRRDGFDRGGRGGRRY
ncbi:MAG: RNA recognition motif domain-containing protein [Planctomycetota bacterium]|jgi:RNA recognition motif-containing protein